MGKVIKINGAGAKEESLKDIFENLHTLKRTLAGVVAEYEENEAEEKKRDLLTEALDALEDAYDAINEVRYNYGEFYYNLYAQTFRSY